MFESIISLLTENKSYILYAIIAIAAVALVYIYVKKYFLLMRENETSGLRDDFQQLRHDLNKLKSSSQQLNSKVNDINTRVKYGQISSNNKHNPGSGHGHGHGGQQLPFTIECMEGTPFYNVIGSHLLNAVVDDELTPTNKPVDDLTVSERPDNLVEEMSEPDFNSSDDEKEGDKAQFAHQTGYSERVGSKLERREEGDQSEDESEDEHEHEHERERESELRDDASQTTGSITDSEIEEAQQITSRQYSLPDGESLVSGDLVLSPSGKVEQNLPEEFSNPTISNIKDHSLIHPSMEFGQTVVHKEIAVDVSSPAEPTPVKKNKLSLVKKKTK